MRKLSETVVFECYVDEQGGEVWCKTVEAMKKKGFVLASTSAPYGMIRKVDVIFEKIMS